MRRRLFGLMLATMMVAGCSKQSDMIPEATIISRESEVIDTDASSEGMTSETDKETEKNISESFEATDVTEEITETNTSQTVDEETMKEEPSEETSTAEASSEEATMEASTEERLAETEVLMTEPEQSAVTVSMTEPILPAETTVQQAQPSTQPPTQPPIETSTISATPTVPEPTTAPITPTEPETTKAPEPKTEETTTAPVTTEPETTTVAPSTEPQKVYHDDYEKAKSGVDMINEYRRAAGVPEVKWSDALYAAALIRAKQMKDARSLDHMTDIGGEIHAMATAPGQAVAGWVASAGHYEYMIDSWYKYCAVAFYDNYCLAMFSQYPILFNTKHFNLVIPESDGRFDGRMTFGEYEKSFFPVDYGVLCAISDQTLFGAKLDENGHYAASIKDENDEKVMLTDEELMEIISRYQ